MKQCAHCTQLIPNDLADQLHKQRSEKGKAVHARMLAEGRPRVSGRGRSLPYDAIAELAKSGWPKRKIARHYNISPSSVTYVLMKMGVLIQNEKQQIAV